MQKKKFGIIIVSYIKYNMKKWIKITNRSVFYNMQPKSMCNSVSTHSHLLFLFIVFSFVICMNFFFFAFYNLFIFLVDWRTKYALAHWREWTNGRTNKRKKTTAKKSSQKMTVANVGYWAIRERRQNRNNNIKRTDSTA